MYQQDWLTDQIETLYGYCLCRYWSNGAITTVYLRCGNFVLSYLVRLPDKGLFCLWFGDVYYHGDNIYKV